MAFTAKAQELMTRYAIDAASCRAPLTPMIGRSDQYPTTSNTFDRIAPRDGRQRSRVAPVSCLFVGDGGGYRGDVEGRMLCTSCGQHNGDDDAAKRRHRGSRPRSQAFRSHVPSRDNHRTTRG